MVVCFLHYKSGHFCESNDDERINATYWVLEWASGPQRFNVQLGGLERCPSRRRGCTKRDEYYTNMQGDLRGDEPARYPLPIGSHSLDQMTPGDLYHSPFPDCGNPGGAADTAMITAGVVRKMARRRRKISIFFYHATGSDP